MKSYLFLAALLMLVTIQLSAQVERNENRSPSFEHRADPFTAQSEQKSSYNYLSNSLSAAELQAEEDLLLKVSHCYIGHFSNDTFVEQADDPRLSTQEFIGVRIWPERKDGIWVYASWLSPGFTEQPLLQAVMHFERGTADTILVSYHRLPDHPSSFRHEWAQPEPFKDLHPKEVLFFKGCTDKIVATDENTFRTCATKLCVTDGDNGIDYTELDTEVNAESINFFTRLYDTDKNIIVAYENGNQFRRLDKENPKYQDLKTE